MSKTRILEIRKEGIIQDKDEDKLTNFDLTSDFKSESVRKTLKNVLSPRQFANVLSNIGYHTTSSLRHNFSDLPSLDLQFCIQP